jgi:filamin
MADDQKWVEVQKKTFTRWANTFLVARNTQIHDLQCDLADGIMLINLLELIQDKYKFQRYNKNPRIVNQKLENLSYCLNFLKQEGLKLVGIGPEDINDGKLKLILGLIWTIILRYHIQKGRQESAKNALLEWVRSKIPEYNVRDFTNSWADGMAICALVNALHADKPVDMSQRSPATPLENAIVGEDAAEKHMQIPKILQPEDMVAASDELSTMTYISYFRDYDENMKKKLSAEEARIAAERAERTPDPSKCSLSGGGLTAGEVNIPAEFVVTARNAAGRPLPQDGDEAVRVPIKIDVDITQPDGSKLPEITVTDNHNSTYTVSYIPRHDGKHPISVSINDGLINKAPSVAIIIPPTPDPSKCTASGPGVEGGEAGDPLPFTVQARNRIGDPIAVGGHPFKADVKGPFVEHVPCTLVDNGNGTYSGQYEPAPGEQAVAITVGNRPIAGSPFVVPVTADPHKAFAGKSFATGNGVEGPVDTFNPAVVTIHAVNPAGEPLKHGGDHFSVDVEGPNGFEVPVEPPKDNGDGTYTAVYRPTEPGPHTVHVKLHHPKNPLFFAHIKNSPVHITAEPGLDPSKCLCFGPGLGGEVYDNKPTDFTVQARDCLGRDIKEGGLPVEVKVTDDEGKEVPVEVKDNGDGTYNVSYQPDKKGNHEVRVEVPDKMLDHNVPLGESPYHIVVKPGADYNHSTIGSFSFVIQTRDKQGQVHHRGGEKMQVVITPAAGGEPVEGVEVQDIGDGTYVARYHLAPNSGDYNVACLLNGHAIKGTPFKQSMP